MSALGRGGVVFMVLWWAGTAALAGTLEQVQERKFLHCGIAQQLPGFAFVDPQGRFRGFDVDFCRGLAAAIGVGVKFISLNAKERFSAL